MGRGGLDGTVHSGAAFCIMKAPIPGTEHSGPTHKRRQLVVTLQELQARHSPEKQARIRAFAEELLKTFEANHATYVNARKALEAAEKERRRQKALARKRARAEAAKLRAAKAKAAEKAAKAEEKTREKAKAKAAEASKEKTQA